MPTPVKRINPGLLHDTAESNTLRDRQAKARIRQALMVALRRQADIRLNLPVTEPPVLSVAPDDAPSIGPADTPITIIKFSDFQCPYCRK